MEGYDPDAYLKAYRDAGSDVNELRRINYAENRERINAQKRAAYAARNEKKPSTTEGKSDKIKANNTPVRNFVSDTLLQSHYEKHIKEFDGISVQEYLKRANILADAPLSDDVVQLTRSDGSTSKYCYSTNEFVVVTAEGDIRTYFKPENKGAYWDEEIERNK